jgi:hypothetical protein
LKAGLLAKSLGQALALLENGFFHSVFAPAQV